MKICLPFFLILIALLPAVGQFTPPVKVAHSPFYEYHHRQYDWDSDGDLDFIGGLDYSFLHLYENTGGGHFANPVLLGEFPFNYNLLDGAEFGDLNGDGRTDIVFRRYPKDILVCLQLSDGQFAAPETIANPFTELSDLTLTDVDGDLDPDLVFLAGGNLLWYENNGAGLFPLTHVIGAAPEQFVTLADANGDGQTDYFTFSSDGDSLRLFVRTGPNQYAQKVVHWAYPYNYLGGLVAADLDGDGRPDLMPRMTDASDNRWAKQLANGDYAPLQPLDPTATWLFWPQGSESMAADLDGDGDVDVVSKGVDSILWYENTGNALFSTHLLATGIIVLGLAEPFIHDMDEDGRPDIVYLNVGGGIGVFSNLGGGQFTPIHYLTPEVKYVGALEPADVNGDGRRDLLICAGPDYRVAWYPNLGADQWGPRQVIDQEEYYLLFLKPVDLDGDGDMDLVTGKQDAGGAPYLHEIARYENLGDGHFGPAETIAFMPKTSLWIADADGDGDADLFGNFDGTVPSGAWLTNDGTGHFSAPVFVDPGSDTSTLLQVSDLDRDTDPDLLIETKTGPVWYANDGSGAFAGPFPLTSSVSTYGLLGAANVDEDSLPDLLYIYQQSLVWAHNSGAGGLEPPQQVSPASLDISNPYGARLVDLNGDGTTDILCGFYDHAYGWVPNLGGGVFGERRILGVSSDFNIQFRSGDLDGNGDQEIIYAQTSEFGYYPDFESLPDVRGRCFLDENENGQQDAGEPALPGITLSLDPAATWSYTDYQGRFRFFAVPGTYTVSLVHDSCWALSTDSAGLQLTLPLPSGTEVVYGFRPVSGAVSVTTSIVSNPPICGQTVPFWLTLQNTGCHAVKARCRLVVGSQLTWQSASPAPTDYVGDTLYWQTTDPLQPGEMRSFVSWINISPAVAGDVPVVTGIAETLAPDGVTALQADTFQYAVPVLCSYDPNDKLVNITELPENYGADSSLLIYTIRFQNTGNFTAFNIRLRDTLDAALDGNSVRPLDTSHPGSVSFDPATRLLQFDFPNIHLADQASNEPASHGFAVFSVRLLPGLTSGAITRNRAGIYFDVNPPVITNRAETKVRGVVSTHAAAAGLHLGLSPNPARDQATLFFPEKQMTDGQVQVFDLQGQFKLQTLVCVGSGTVILPVTALPAGSYFVRYQSKDGIRAQAFFVKI